MKLSSCFSCIPCLVYPSRFTLSHVLLLTITIALLALTRNHSTSRFSCHPCFLSCRSFSDCDYHKLSTYSRSKMSSLAIVSLNTTITTDHEKKRTQRWFLMLSNLNFKLVCYILVLDTQHILRYISYTLSGTPLRHVFWYIYKNLS